MGVMRHSLKGPANNPDRPPGTPGLPGAETFGNRASKLSEASSISPLLLVGNDPSIKAFLMDSI